MRLGIATALRSVAERLWETSGLDYDRLMSDPDLIVVRVCWALFHLADRLDPPA